MGIVYVGPYADEVHADADHEGYAARLMRDGTLTGSWGGEHGWTGHVGFVGACACGWRSAAVHPPGDYDSTGYQAAEADFETEHLDPLIDAARQRSWPDWAARTISRANETANHIAARRMRDAQHVLDLLRDDLARHINIAEELAEERERDNDTDQVADVPEAHDPYGRPFRALADPTPTADPIQPPSPPHGTPPRGRGR